MKRRTFLSSLGAGAGAASQSFGLSTADPASVDFRYSPLQWQTAFCFPDDKHKSLASHRGELLYGHPGRRNIEYFPVVVEFSMAGMQPDAVTHQKLEAPGVPIVHTRIERPEAFLELVTFATNREREGRVDNVLMSIRPRSRRQLHAVPLMTVRTRQELSLERTESQSLLYLNGESKQLLLAIDAPVNRKDAGWGWLLVLTDGVARSDRPLEVFLRFPQEGQAPSQLALGVNAAAELLAEARSYWQNWRPFGGDVSWRLPGVHNDFLTACARNILQARETRDGRLTFQVGPTCYRGLWVVDGHFILEAARYLGYDAEARQGLETTWTYQQPSGALHAGAGKEHWKDAAIAMFSLVRQVELDQDWAFMTKMQPNIAKAVEFLRQVREQGRGEGSPNGRYGLLAKGFGDGGLRLCAELTNTVWSLAGLKAVAEAANTKKLAGFEVAAQLYAELRSAFDHAARQEMRTHPAGFEYLPMLLKDDPLWDIEDEWVRPKPQAAQWALSHAIYPGVVFEKEDPVVRGHIALMQACTQEEVPIETGWLPNEGLWTYNAPFVAHVYLWAGLPEWARSTFTGFLNHSTPLFCWREEQPLRHSLACGYVGDMPHNWASAECVLFLRHMLVLEDRASLRLLAGVGDPELALREPFQLRSSPTRFGRVHLSLEPAGRRAWRLRFERGAGPAPAVVEAPAALGTRHRYAQASGADAAVVGNRLRITPRQSAWEILWQA